MEPIVDSVVYVIPQAGGFITEWATLLSAIATTASVVIAITAVFFTRKQVRMHEQHNRLMVQPHLDGMTIINTPECIYKYEITNNGIGPAILTHAEVFVDDKRVVADDEIEAAMNILTTSVPHHRWGHESPAVGAYITPGQCVELITIQSKDGFTANNFRDLVRKRSYLIVHYKSIYGQQFVFDSRAS